MTHALRQAMPGLLSLLHAKFGENLSSLDEDVISNLDAIDTSLRSISFLSDNLEIGLLDCDRHRQGSASFLREVFSDLGQAMYLQCVGLLVPGRMSTRRAFELGLASVYVWDLPHIYWGWVKCDTDLSFSEMVSHLVSEPYAEMIRFQQDNSTPINISPKECHRIYRQLSNTVHGKHLDLPMLSPIRFKAEKANVVRELGVIQAVSKIVIDAWKARIPTCLDNLNKTVGA